MADKASRILTFHANDPEIVFHVGLLKKRQGKPQDALDHIERAADLFRSKGEKILPRVYLEIAESQIMAGHCEDAAGQLHLVLRDPDVTAEEFRRAIDLLQQTGEAPVSWLAELPVLGRFEAQEITQILERLHMSRAWQRVAADVVARVLLPNVSTLPLDDWQTEAALVLIGVGQFADARRVITGGDRVTDFDGNIRHFFNWAMATWGAQTRVPIELFERVVEIDRASPNEIAYVNYEQCLALASHLAGHEAEAMERLNSSRRLSAERPFLEFSCWSYLMLAPKDFAADLDEMQRFFAGQEILPRFMGGTVHSHDSACPRSFSSSAPPVLLFRRVIEATQRLHSRSLNPVQGTSGASQLPRTISDLALCPHKLVCAFWHPVVMGTSAPAAFFRPTAVGFQSTHLGAPVAEEPERLN